MRTLKQFKASRKYSLNQTEERRKQLPFTEEGLCKPRVSSCQGDGARSSWWGWMSPSPPATTPVPPQYPASPPTTRTALVLLLLSVTAWALGSSNTTRSSGASFIKSWVWAGACWGGLNNSSFLARKTAGTDISVRHVPQSTAGALPTTELHSQWTRILTPADT